MSSGFGRRQRPPVRRDARVLVYSHDTYGLGHLRRCLLLIERLAALPEVGPILLATGSPRAEAFDLPPNCDRFALPALTKDHRGGYRARSLGTSLLDVLNVRTELLRAAAVSFRPDLVLVDHAPVGVMGELRPALEALSSRLVRPHFVLGLRDVIDEAQRVRREWSRTGAWDAVDTLYDRILVYGDPGVVTTARELGLPFRRPGAVRHTGYLARRMPAGRVRAGLPTILVTTGGGGDGHHLLRAYASFLETVPAPAPFRSIVVTGPLLSRRRRVEIRSRLEGTPHPVEVHEFTNRFEDLLAGADGVVSMGGYNTVTEVLAARLPVLLVPREQPRLEQSIRAERLANAARVEWCPPGSLDVARLDSFVRRVLSGAARAPEGVRLDGADHAAAEIRALLRGTATARVLRREVQRVGAIS